MLAPTDRRLLLDALSPPDLPEGYTLDQAIGTTYTLDLLALLRVPLAATALPWSSPDGRPSQNPFALLTALRRNADRISLYCHAGATSVPGRFIPLLAFLEGAVHPVTPPNPAGIFHPKLWLLRFVGGQGSVRYRLLVLSRNLTFDRSWDIALALDGELLNRKRSIGENAPIAEFISSLPSMARKAGTRMPQSALDRAERLGDEVRRVRWEKPDGFDQITFCPIGHDGKPSWPVYDFYRLLVIAPFVSAEGLAALSDETRHEALLIGRFEELAKLNGEDLADFASVHIFDDPSKVLEIGDDPEVIPDEEADDEPVELSGLHAKVFAGERDRRAAVYVGSANATTAAFDKNVEFLVELEGSRSQHGVKPLMTVLTDAGLLTEFKPGEPIEIDEEAEALDRALERAAHALACRALRAKATQSADERWTVTIHRAGALDFGDLRLSARPLSAQTYRTVDLASDPSCAFPPTGRSSVTPFFAMKLTGRAGSKERSHEFVVKLDLAGAPDGRPEAVTAELLSDRERLLRFILLLLGNEFSADRALDELERLLTDDGPPINGPNGALQTIGLPLLEPMMRALHRAPERLGEIAQLIEDLEEAGANDDLVPDELRELWTAVNEVRAER